MIVHPEFLDQSADEVLEQIWYRREEGRETLEALLDRFTEPQFRTALERLREDGLVRVEGDRLALSPDAERRARDLVRRHRLTERLMSDVLDRPLDESEHAACLLEHALSPAITDAVCTFLGHPPTCPHGLPIPSGACCEAKRHDASPVVVPLGELEPGQRGRIVFMTPGFRKRLARLESFGVVPGTVVTLRQRRPSFVLEIEGTSLALESDVAREIYVRREA